MIFLTFAILISVPIFHFKDPSKDEAPTELKNRLFKCLQKAESLKCSSVSFNTQLIESTKAAMLKAMINDFIAFRAEHLKIVRFIGHDEKSLGPFSNLKELFN